MKRDARGCRVYARIPDANGSTLLVKQATCVGVDNRGQGKPTDHVWLFLERVRGAASEPLLSPEATKALIAALQLHLKHMNDGPDMKSPLEPDLDAVSRAASCSVCAEPACGERSIRVPGHTHEVRLMLCRDHLSSYRSGRNSPEVLVAVARRILAVQAPQARRKTA